MYNGRYQRPTENGTAAHRPVSAVRAAKIKKRKRQQRLFFGGSATVLILLVVGIILLVKGCSGNDTSKALCGTWRYDQITVYTFNEDGSGNMNVQGNQCIFSYSVKDTVISIDYAAETVSDCEYEYTVDGDTLTLTGGKGTVGGTYTLTKETP